MKKCLSIAFLGIVVCSFLPNTAFAQVTKDKYRDQVWIFGTDASGSPGVDGTLFSFSTDPPQAKYVSKPIEQYVSTAIICDTTGNLLFYTNGHQVVNGKQKKLYNSGMLNSGDLLKDLGIASAQSLLILPLPSNNDLYVLLHPLFKATSDDYAAKVLRLHYTLISASGDNGAGALVQPNRVIIDDTLDLGMIMACRHANGRDWWILAPEIYTGRYHRLLLDPSGLHWIGIQSEFASWGRKQAFGQASFSPNGLHYARVRTTLNFIPDTLALYDFDRCTGLLNNPRLLTNPKDSVLGGGGLAFSPNSRYLYKTPGGHLYQYDMDAPDIAASRILVARADTTNFFNMQLGPDGKIYVGLLGANTYLHRIDYPDLPGKACGICIGCVHLASYNWHTMPNFPNFRLGPLKGSPCDTLGLNGAGEVEQRAGYEVWPNPVSGVLTIGFPDGEVTDRTVEVFGILGTLSLKVNLPTYAGTTLLDLSNLSSGVYWLVVKEKGRTVFTSKVIKL